VSSRVVRAERAVYDRLLDAQIGIVAENYFLFTGCTSTLDIVQMDDGRLIAKCNHPFHPEMECEKWMAS
jgi:hypothetical protein